MALQAEPDVPDESGGVKDKDYLLVRKLKSDVSPRGSTAVAPGILTI